MLKLEEKEFTGRAIRYAIMATHYKKPLNWTDKCLEDAKAALHKFYKLLDGKELCPEDDDEFVAALYDDLNTPKALSILHTLAKKKELNKLLGSLNLIGLGINSQTKKTEASISGKEGV